jgi:HlyD family secretion protein
MSDSNPPSKNNPHLVSDTLNTQHLDNAPNQSSAEDIHPSHSDPDQSSGPIAPESHNTESTESHAEDATNLPAVNQDNQGNPDADKQPAKALVRITKEASSQLQNWYHDATEHGKYGPRVSKMLQSLDHSSRYMFDGDAYQDPNDINHQTRRSFVFGIWVLFITFGIFGAWSALAPIDSAAVARGIIVVDSSKKTIQHLEGGIIQEILIREGDEVKAGQALIRLSETSAKTRNDSLDAQLTSLIALEQRLIAERDHKNLVLPKGLEDRARENSKIQELIDTQKQLYETRSQTLQGKLNVLGQRRAQLEDEIRGLSAQESAVKSQLGLIAEETNIVRQLLKTGDANKPRLLSLQRREQELKGQQGQLIASIAKAKQAITEAELQVANTRNDFLNDVVKELQQIQINLADIQEKSKASRDILDRVVISAPLDGRVNNLAFHTIGGVISPGTPIMEIIPTHDKLVVEAYVAPTDIDVVHQGLTARVLLTAYKSRNIPYIYGKVISVAADRSVDKNTGQAYYSARVEVDKDALSTIRNVELYPGMPADILIVTGSRSFLSYLLAPLTDSMRHAFRD